jgi:hypothetical protein
MIRRIFLAAVLVTALILAAGALPAQATIDTLYLLIAPTCSSVVVSIGYVPGTYAPAPNTLSYRVYLTSDPGGADHRVAGRPA